MFANVGNNTSPNHNNFSSCILTSNTSLWSLFSKILGNTFYQLLQSLGFNLPWNISSECNSVVVAVSSWSHLTSQCSHTASKNIIHCENTRKCSCSIGWASEVLGKCWHFQLHWGSLIWICIGFLPAGCQIWIHISLLGVEYVMTCKWWLVKGKEWYSSW